MYLILSIITSNLVLLLFSFSSIKTCLIFKKNQEMYETQVQFLGEQDLLEEGVATHSNILARRIPWIEEAGGLQSIGSQRIQHK